MDLLNFLAQAFGEEGAADELKKLRSRFQQEAPPGSQVGSGMAERQMTDEGYDANAPINVQGLRDSRAPDPRPQSQGPSYTDPEPRPEITPRYVLNDDRMPPTKDELREIIPRSEGYFGSKGTLRNILGTLSDAFLVQSGNKAEYSALRDREKKGDAMYGFTDNPQQAMERLASRGYGEDASTLQNNYATQEQNRVNSESTAAARESLASDRKFDNREKAYTRLSRLTKAGVPYDQLMKFAAANGLDSAQIEAMGIRPDMTPEERDQIGAFDISGNNQQMFPLQERRTATGEKNAESSRIRANRPPVGRAPRSQTELEYFQDIGRKPPAQRTPAENDFYKKFTQGTGRRTGGRVTDRKQVTPPIRQGWSSSPRN
jgi:hypothetical protein